MKVLLVDNFDSFTFNLYQYLGELADSVEVVRNIEIPFEDVEEGLYTHIVISPGPGDPTDPEYFGQNRKLIEKFHKRYPILGICLGHQGIGAYFGGKIVKSPKIMHGKTSTFSHSGTGLLQGLPDEITVMRYHSLVVDEKDFPNQLNIDAKSDDGSIMAFHHSAYPVYGLQFHPESFRTETGKKILSNFLEETSL